MASDRQRERKGKGAKVILMPLNSFLTDPYFVVLHHVFEGSFVARDVCGKVAGKVCIFEISNCSEF